jgi:outer membrane protein assembly factor BamE (lipoprotein component of BamABCDE complex)
MNSFCILLSAASCLLSAAQWQSPAAWDKLAKGMTELQIKSILGTPLEVESGPTGQTWYYQQPPAKGVIRLRRSQNRPDAPYLLYNVAKPDFAAIPATPAIPQNPEIESSQKRGLVRSGDSQVVPVPAFVSPPPAPALPNNSEPKSVQSAKSVVSPVPAFASPQPARDSAALSSRWLIGTGIFAIAAGLLIAISHGAKMFR